MADRVKLAKPEEVAEWLQITPAQLARLRKTKQGPRSFKLDRVTIRYAWADVHAWCAANRARDGR